jgi:hypothetical protein
LTVVDAGWTGAGALPAQTSGAATSRQIDNRVFMVWILFRIGFWRVTATPNIPVMHMFSACAASSFERQFADFSTS